MHFNFIYGWVELTFINELANNLSSFISLIQIKSNQFQFDSDDKEI